VAAEHDVAQVLELEHGPDVGDVRVEVDRGPEQVRAVSEAGEGRAMGDVAERS